MGCHYIPRYYLKGFTEVDDSEFIWAYEKGTQNYFRANIINVAQETRFYSDETESYLTDAIEQPANKVLDKIRREEDLTFKDKVFFSRYMSVLLKRVPKARERAMKIYDDISKSDPDWYANRIDSSVEAQELWEALLPPEKTPDVSLALQMMKWKFLVFDEEPIFLTSDNPIFFPPSLGIGNRKSEVTFPISTTILLWAAWSEDIEEEYVTITKDIADEINQWTISVATRYVYFSEQADWILDLLKEK